MASLLLSRPGPRSPNRCFLLRDPDQNHAILALLGCHFQIGASDRLFVLALLEMHEGDMVSLSQPIDRLDIFIADVAKGSRRRNPEFPLPAEQRASFSHGL
jgi:hypothetical protein